MHYIYLLPNLATAKHRTLERKASVKTGLQSWAVTPGGTFYNYLSEVYAF